MDENKAIGYGPSLADRSLYCATPMPLGIEAISTNLGVPNVSLQTGIETVDLSDESNDSYVRGVNTRRGLADQR